MKKIVILALILIFFASCNVRFENSYTIARVEHDGQDYITTIKTEANYGKNDIIELKGQAFQVLFVNSTEIK